MNNIPVSENLINSEVISRMIQSNLLMKNITNPNIIAELALLKCLTSYNNYYDFSGLNSLASALFTQYSMNINQANLNYLPTPSTPKPVWKVFSPKVIVKEQVPGNPESKIPEVKWGTQGNSSKNYFGIIESYIIRRDNKIIVQS